MLDGVTSNNLYANSAEASVLASRMKLLGYSDIDAKSMLFLTSKGNQENVLDTIGLQLGINEKPSDSNLSFEHYVSATGDQNNYLFQGEDGNLYNLDFTGGTYSEKSIEEFAEENGFIKDGDKFYDIVDFGQDEASFIDYAFGGTGDGKLDKVEVAAGNETWSSVKWVRQEVNYSSWSAGANDVADAVSSKAFSNILKHKDQWLNSVDEAEILKSVNSYEEYLQRVAEKIVEKMDETGKADTDKINISE